MNSWRKNLERGGNLGKLHHLANNFEPLYNAVFHTMFGGGMTHYIRSHYTTLLVAFCGT
jgi:hypothetical protein